MSKPKKKFINLDKNVHAKPVQWKLDCDYLDKLKKQAANGDSEAIQALEFMNTYLACELDNDFRNSASINMTPKIRSEMSSSRDASRRDIYSTGFADNIPDETALEILVNDRPGFAELAEEAEAVSKAKRKAGFENYLRKKKAH